YPAQDARCDGEGQGAAEMTVRTWTGCSTRYFELSGTQTCTGPVGDSTMSVPVFSTPMMRPVTTAWSPGSGDGDAAGSEAAGGAPEPAGTMSTGCTDMSTRTLVPGWKRCSAPAAAHTCSGPCSELTDTRPRG